MAKRPPVVLLTNDDGIGADGILTLRRQLVASGRFLPYVVAPDRERSASGHSITIFNPLRVDEVPFDEGPMGWKVSGTPVDCVKLALKALLPEPPELVVSGINRGANLGTDVFYSGTVSGALEACLLGLPAMAVSLTSLDRADYATAAVIAEYLAGEVVSRGLPKNTLLNVNIPSLALEHLAGIQATTLGVHRYNDVFERRVDPHGRTYYWLKGEVLDIDDEPGSDARAIRDNCVSVTPIQLDMTNHPFRREVEGWGLDLAKVAAPEARPPAGERPEARPGTPARRL